MKSILLGAIACFLVFCQWFAFRSVRRYLWPNADKHQSERSLFSADSIWTVNYSRCEAGVRFRDFTPRNDRSADGVHDIALVPWLGACPFVVFPPCETKRMVSRIQESPVLKKSAALVVKAQIEQKLTANLSNSGPGKAEQLNYPRIQSPTILENSSGVRFDVGNRYRDQGGRRKPTASRSWKGIGLFTICSRV